MGDAWAELPHRSEDGVNRRPHGMDVDAQTKAKVRGGRPGYRDALSLAGADAEPTSIYDARRSAQGPRVTTSCGACAASSRAAIESGVALAEVYMKATRPLAVTSEVTL